MLSILSDAVLKTALYDPLTLPVRLYDFLLQLSAVINRRWSRRCWLKTDRLLKPRQLVDRIADVLTLPNDWLLYFVPFYRM